MDRRLFEKPETASFSKWIQVKPLRCFFPQGSVLGPLLFIIYINSMVVKAGDTNLHLYADDLKLYREIKTDEDVETLQTDLDKLHDWTQYSLLKFHPDKCVVMRLMSSRSKKFRPNALYNMDERLKAVEVKGSIRRERPRNFV